ncbi:MAG: bifunctional phosphopantothenoylcysteine decarboxylase/phosphopantothenate--cysteine ligase CoaBC [Chloroflexi bacterium]|nr:bifunctional phosphopantothenoylcysteine decarboxylase/phosphopantothenate--cysteine ligase CoaBC [Chloroflexota bacterium]
MTHGDAVGNRVATGDPVRGKRIVLGVSGGIAAYKVADLASKLVQAGAQVTVTMTRSAQEFVRPLTFQSITHRPVYDDVFDAARSTSVAHVFLATENDLLVVAPATANVLAKLANGLADDVLTCVALATPAPILVAPAMEDGMWSNAATQRNVALLRERGVRVVGPAHGRLASGRVGQGRLVEVEELLSEIRQIFAERGDLAGRRVVVSAGGTHEPIDPVRFVGNRSSGRMGYALAESARDRGAKVTLVSGPSSLSAPRGVELVRVETAFEMLEAVQRSVVGADVLIMSAAVADYRPRVTAAQKLKRTTESMEILLERNPDILGAVAKEAKGRTVLVGFAAETQDLLANARSKLTSKGIDLIVANDVMGEGSGFGSETNKVTIVGLESEVDVPLLPKYEVAHQVLDEVVRLLSKRGHAGAG